ncbi:MAG: CAMP factor family pore-forming toxin [Peptoniphilus sp.]|nr:CAMP factor family pore-forming toxin [Peptoniphilus sp.]MDD7362883.1 CAMP factor family pore-forming toxin [Bacillota bacterium]MDY6044876.1 CAMP factor family pore-forming toxin [Peptoniphilus sp.]
MKRKSAITAVLAITMLSTTVAPAVYAVGDTSPAVTTTLYAETDDKGSLSEIDSKMDELNRSISDLEKISGILTGDQLDWLKQLKEGFDLINKLIHGQIANLSSVREKLIARIDLMINVSEVITADATELVDSEQQAHVIIGFGVTRALLKGTDPFASTDDLNKASENVKDSLERAREIPKQTEDSVRSHYNLERLNRAISRAKDLRNREFRHKLNPGELAKVDLIIRKAEGVRADRTATVGEVKTMTQQLNDAVDEAFLSIPEEQRAADDVTRFPLEKSIQEAKNLRDFSLKGQVDSVVIKELNREISNAERVLRNKNATVSQVQDANETMTKAIEKAASALQPVVEEQGEADVEAPAPDEAVAE